MASTDINASIYAVFFLDILGQNKKYREVGQLMPFEADGDYNIIKEKIINSTRPVYAINNLIKQHVAPMSKKNITNIAGPKEATLNEIKVIGISDAVLIATSLRHEVDRRLVVLSLHSILTACASIINLLLGMKCALRGGCDLGWGLELDGQLHGYSLTSAYYIESHIAVFPRIVISEEMVSYIHDIIKDTDDSPIGRITKIYAEKSLRIISRDSDRQYVVDFLGEGFLEIVKESGRGLFETMKKFINDSSSFIDESLKHAIDNKEHKLASKYGYLRRYYDENMHRWL